MCTRFLGEIDFGPMGRRAKLFETFFLGIAAPVSVVFGILRAVHSSSLQDFGSFYESGKAAAAGINPYAIYPLTNVVSTASFCGYNFNLNPPTLLPLFEAFSLFPATTAFNIWSAFSIASGIAMIAMLFRAYRDTIDKNAVLWLAGLAVIWDTLYLGQLYLALALVCSGAWLLLRQQREIPAGILIGILAAAKPNFLVWPALLLIAGRYRVSSTAILTSSVIVLASLRYGPDVYTQWFHLVGSDSARVVFPTNGSVMGLFARLGMPLIGQYAAATILAAAAVWAWASRPNVILVSSAALVASVLASPLGWAHYGLFLVPVILDRWSDRTLALSVSTWPLLIPPTLLMKIQVGSWWVLATTGSIFAWAFIGIAYLALASRNQERLGNAWRFSRSS